MSRDWEDTSSFLSRKAATAHDESVAEIKRSRDALGEFTLRFCTEAIYGEEYTRTIFGESGGEIKMRDLEVEFSPRGDGTFGTTIKKETMEQILMEAHPGKSRREIDKMLTEKSIESAPEISAIEKEVAKLDDDEKKIILEFMKNINKK